MSEEGQKNGKPLVLLVEDDTFLCDIFLRKAEESFRVLVSHDGEEALKIAEEQCPDVILLDLNLPGENGFDILKKIRSNKRTEHILVLILTNSVLSEDAIRSNELKADDFLTKANFSIEEIISRMESHLADRVVEGRVENV